MPLNFTRTSPTGNLYRDSIYAEFQLAYAAADDDIRKIWVALSQEMQNLQVQKFSGFLWLKYRNELAICACRCYWRRSKRTLPSKRRREKRSIYNPWREGRGLAKVSKLNIPAISLTVSSESQRLLNSLNG